MIDLNELTEIIEQGLSGLPDDLKQHHRGQLLKAFQDSLSNKARAITQRSTSPDLALLPIRELKHRAKAANIYRYGSMDKAELVAALSNQEFCPALR